jgi:hypothetical protein
MHIGKTMYNITVNSKDGQFLQYVCSERSEVFFLIQTMDKSPKVIRIMVTDNFGRHLNKEKERWNTKKLYDPTLSLINS